MPSGGRREQFSRIVELDAINGSKRTVLCGKKECRFFSAIMAIHKRHSNGNILVTASDEGRVLETSKDGRLLWEYVIVVDEGRAGRVTGAVLLPGHMDVDDFASKKAQCRDIDEQLYVK